MDIGASNKYPANSLSNFAIHPFVIDGVDCTSMEGFLQSLKFKDIEMQKYVCSLHGYGAKLKGKKKRWWRTQTLWWQGKPYKRDSQEYQDLLKRAYTALSKSPSFRIAIKASGDAVYTHSIGKRDITHTVLTETEFVSMLNMCRKLIQESL